MDSIGSKNKCIVLVKIPEFLLCFEVWSHVSYIDETLISCSWSRSDWGSSLFLSAQICCHGFCFHVRYTTRQSYFCPPEGLDTLSAGRMRAADKRLQEVRPDYLLSEQSAAVAQIHTHIVRYVRDGIIAGLSNMFRASNTRGFSASGHDWTFFIVSRFGGKPRATGWTETCSETGYWLSNGRPGTVVWHK